MLRLKPLGHLSKTARKQNLRLGLPLYRNLYYLARKMTQSYTVRVRDRRTGTIHTFEAPADRYILQTGEKQDTFLPCSCRNGACTTCAVRVISGEIYQPEAMGLSPELRKRGYALLCVGYARSDLELETQDEDEVYEQQFGRYFAKGKVRFGMPLDEE